MIALPNMNLIQAKLVNYLLIFGLLICSVFSKAQTSIYIHGVDSVFLKEIPDSFFRSMHVDSLSALVQEELYFNSFLAASLDSIQVRDSIVDVYMYQGPKILWSAPYIDSASLAILTASGIPVLPNLVESSTLLNWQTDLIKKYADSGFPFAALSMEKLFVSGDTLFSTLKFEKGPLIRIGKVENEFNIGIKSNVLASLLGVPEGSIFKISEIQNLDNKIRNFNYLEQTREPRLSFEDGEAVITLFLKQRKASSLNLLLGLIPAGNIPGNRLTLTGLADIKTQNLLGQGERLAFKFERLLAETQTIDLNLSFPFVFNQPIGLEGELYQNRRDSSFNLVQGEVGLASYFKGTNRVSLFYGWEQSNLLSFDEANLIAQRELPNTLDTRARNYGLNLDYSKLDYFLNPRKGIELRSKTTFSQKRIIPNPVISDLSDPLDPDFDFSELYNEQILETNLLFKQELLFAFYLPIVNRLVLKNSTRGAYQYAGREILRNEQWILGGNSNLRGFNEGLLFADAYLVEVFELRYILDQNAYLFGFSDLARLWTGKTFDDYIGMGLGLSFEVQAGIFGISLAIGKTNNLPFDFSSPKVHFGFINQF